MSDWQPIETAPKEIMEDHRSCLINDGGFVCEAWYDPDRSGWWRANTDFTDYYDGEINPTHWQPLPPPPQEASE